MREVLDSKASESPLVSSTKYHKNVGSSKKWMPIFLLIIVFFLLIITIVTLSILLLTKKSNDIKITEATRIISSIANFKADPCTNFHDFACGNFAKSVPRPPHKKSWNSFIWAAHMVNLKLHEVLVSPEKKPSAAVVKMKDYYESCFDNFNPDLTPLIKVVGELGGWPLAGGPEKSKALGWNETAWSLQESLKVSFSYQCFPFMQLITIPVEDPPLPMMLTPVLTLKQSTNFSDDLAEKAFREAVFYSLKKLMDFEGKGMGDVDDQITKMWELEKGMKIIMEVHETTENDTINVVQIESSFEPWLKFRKLLSAYYQTAISPTEKLLCKAQSYFQNLKDLISNNSNRTLANYLVWTVVRTISTEITTQFESADEILEKLEKLKKNQNNIGKNDDKVGFSLEIPRWEQCINNLVNHFEFAIASSFVKRHIKPRYKSDVKKMCERLIEIAQKYQPKFFDEKTKRKSVEKISKIKCQIAYPSFILNASKLDEYYEAYEGGSNYLGNEISHRLFKTQIAIREHGLKMNQQHWLASPVLLNAYASLIRNEVTIFAGMMQTPIFYADAPEEINLGCLGATLAHELSHLLLPPGSNFNGEGEKEEWWTEATKKAFKEVEKCYVDTFGRLKMFNRSINGQISMKENMADSAGLWMAFHALLDSFGGGETGWGRMRERTDVAGLNLTRAQLFFVAYAQKLCSIYDEKDSEYMFNRPHTFNNIRMQGTLENNREFAQVFDCPSKSIINSENKCHIF